MEFLEINRDNCFHEQITNSDTAIWYLETAKHLDPEIEMDGVEYKLTLANLTDDQISHRVTQMQWRLNDSSLYNQCSSPNEQLANDIEHQCKAMYMIGYEDNGNPKGLTVYDMEKSLVNLRRIAMELKAVNEVYTRKCEIDMKVLQYYKAPSSVDIDTNKFQEYYQLDANVSGSSSDHACADESGYEENACSVPPKRFIKCRVKGTKIVAHVLITRSIITTLGGVPSGHLDSKRCSMDGTEENSDDDYDFDA